MLGVPIVVQGKQIQLGTMRLWVQSLALFSKLRIKRCHELSRRGSNLILLWLWHRPAAVAPIQLLAWEAPYASGETLKSKKPKQTDMNLKERWSPAWGVWGRGGGG